MSALASWAALDPAERRARCRALAALARVFAGLAGSNLMRALRLAETDVASLELAAVALRALPSTTTRRMWSIMAALGE